MLARHRSLTKGFGFTIATNLVDRFGVFKDYMMAVISSLKRLF